MKKVENFNSVKLRSHLFDKELIEKGEWEEEWKREFELWNEEDYSDVKKQIALNIMKKIIVQLLGEDSVPRGRVRIDRLGKMLDKLEQLLISTKTLDNKYYRDHLNHSIRVVLLSKILAKYKPFNLKPEEINLLILSNIPPL